MINARAMAGIAITLVVAAGCAAPPPPSGAFQPNPKRADAAPLTLIDTVPPGHRCTVTGGNAPPLTITTPRLVALYEYGNTPVIDCFGEGFLRERKAVPADRSNSLAERLIVPGAVDPAFGPYPKRAGLSGRGEFPTWVRIRLQRNIFDTAAERDRYYAEEARWTDAAWAATKDRLDLECQSRRTEAQGLIVLDQQCKKALRALAERQTTDRATVEVNRRQSTIR